MKAPADVSSLPGELRRIALDVARSASQLVMTRLGQHRVVDTKSSPLDLVTEVDRESEAHITESLLALRASDGIVGEEGTGVAGSSGVDWSIDPIDGTTSFVYGLPGFSVSIAARSEGRVVAGAVVAPVIGSEFHAAIDEGAIVDSRHAQCRDTAHLSEALVGTGFSPDHARRTRQAAVIGELLPEIRDIRRMGSAALDLAAVAAGQLDAYYEDGLSPWDYEAGILLASEAGARVIVTPDPVTGRSWVFASAPGIADALLSRIEVPKLSATDAI